MTAKWTPTRPLPLLTALATFITLLPRGDLAHAGELHRLGIATRLVTTPIATRFGPPEEPAAEAPPQDPDWVDAERLFRQGSARYSAANYSAAIQDFQAALELVAKHDYDPSVELALLVNLARAHRRAYEIDRDVLHLRTALEINRRIKRVTPPESDESAEATEAITEIEGLLTKIEEKTDEPASSEPADNGEGRDRGSKPAKKPAKPGTGFIAGGAALMVVGAGGIGLMGYGLSAGAKAESDGEKLAGTSPTDAQIAAIEDDGKLGNTLAIVGGVVGGLGLAGGAALIGLGVKKRQLNRHVALAPSFQRNYAGLWAEVRF